MVTYSFGNRNFMQPMGRLSMHSKCLVFFPFKFWVVGGRFFSFFLLFPTCSLQVSNVFPIATRFNLTCFAQSPPLFTFIVGQRGEALHLSIEPSIQGSSIVSAFFCMGQSNWLKKKVRLVRHPQLINMKQNKYPEIACSQ
jgi:hypothetical protein